MSDNLQKNQGNAINNIRWSAVSQIGRLSLQLLGLAILSRLLLPVDFGIVAMSTVVTELAVLFRDMGTAAALIQKKTINSNAVNTVFLLNVVFGIFMAVMIVTSAPLVAYAFQTPVLVGVLWVLAPGFPIAACTAVHKALLERESQFRKLAWIEIGSTIIGLSVAIFSAVNGGGAYSLAFQTIAATASSTIMLWIVSNWRPRLKWSQEEFRSLLHFSGHLTGFNLIHYLNRNSDKTIIGRVLGSVDLGGYTLVLRVVHIPYQTLNVVVNRALFPIFSGKQEYTTELAQLYFRTASVVALISSPTMGIILALREPFIHVLFGNQWIFIADVLLWLAPVGLMQSLASTTSAVFMATGKTDVMMRLSFYNATLAVTSFIVGVQWGLQGVAICFFIATLLSTYLCFNSLASLLKCQWCDMCKAFGMPLIASCFSTSLISIANYKLRDHGLGYLFNLTTLSFVGLTVYGATIYIFNPSLVKEASRILLEKNHKIKENFN